MRGKLLRDATTELNKNFNEGFIFFLYLVLFYQIEADETYSPETCPWYLLGTSC